jgi:hypothetical protein
VLHFGDQWNANCRDECVEFARESVMTATRATPLDSCSNRFLGTDTGQMSLHDVPSR